MCLDLNYDFDQRTGTRLNVSSVALLARSVVPETQRCLLAGMTRDIVLVEGPLECVISSKGLQGVWCPRRPEEIDAYDHTSFIRTRSTSANPPAALMGGLHQ